MHTEWEKKLDLLGPLAQAERCLERWLEEEHLALTPAQKKRAAALMARYFQYEDEVTDELMLSFLRHYSGKQAVDMEDPSSVRMEIKSVLDTAQEDHPARRRWLGCAALALLVALAALGFTQRKATAEQQAEIKALVKAADEADPARTAAAIRNEVKSSVGVRRYDDMTWWDYWRGKRMLREKAAP